MSLTAATLPVKMDSRPQTLRESEIIDILSAELAQSEAERN